MNVGQLMPVAEFKKLAAAKQRKAVAEMYHALNVGDADTVAWWIGEYAGDLLDERASLVAAFDVWYVVTKVYDVDLPNDVIECIAEGDNPRSWRNLLQRHGLAWNRCTRAELQDLGVERK